MLITIPPEDKQKASLYQLKKVQNMLRDICRIYVFTNFIQFYICAFTNFAISNIYMRNTQL